MTPAAGIRPAAGVTPLIQGPTFLHMILNDKEITRLALEGMITPFTETSVNRNPDNRMNRVMSYGVSSYGYDLRLSAQDFQVFHRPPGEIINPKQFKATHLEPAVLHEKDGDHYFILPANSYGLGVAVECLDIPGDVIAICVGKSSYARAGLIVNCTPVEPGWRGHLTLEFSNSCASDCMLFANEGICQLLFFRGEPCEISYDDRRGKYQDQPESVKYAR